MEWAQLDEYVDPHGKRALIRVLLSAEQLDALTSGVPMQYHCPLCWMRISTDQGEGPLHWPHAVPSQSEWFKLTMRRQAIPSDNTAGMWQVSFRHGADVCRWWDPPEEEVGGVQA